jgi:hypothetical protein
MTDTTIPRKRGRPRTLSDAERAERQRAAMRNYRSKDPEALNARRREMYKANPEKVNARQRERRAKDPEAANAYQREYRAKRISENPETVLEAERAATRRSRAKRAAAPDVKGDSAS